MNDSCNQWKSWALEDAPGDRATDAARETHRAECRTCREQWSAHQALTALGELPPPPLSPGLGQRVRRAVAELAPESMLSPSRRLLMRLYWLLATFTAGVILAQLGPASVAWIFFWLCLAALAVAGLPVLLLLRRRLSWGLVDLVVWTFR